MNRSHVSCCHILLASLYSGTGKQAHRPTLPADTQAPTSTCSSKIRRCTLHVHISPRALALAAALATPPAGPVPRPSKGINTPLAMRTEGMGDI